MALGREIIKSDSLGFLAPNLPALPAFGPRFSFCMNAATAFVSIRSEMCPLRHGRAGGKSLGRVTNSWTYHDTSIYLYIYIYYLYIEITQNNGNRNHHYLMSDFTFLSVWELLYCASVLYFVVDLRMTYLSLRSRRSR